jgi:hypothetical protein
MLSPSQFWEWVLQVLTAVRTGLLFLRLTAAMAYIWLKRVRLRTRGDEREIAECIVDARSELNSGSDSQHVRTEGTRKEGLEGVASSVEKNATAQVVEDGKGRRVKDLSRLWRYMNGATC